MADDTKLSKKQEAFVNAYLKSFNGAEAGRIAGYAHPSVEATRLLANPKIKKAINDHLDTIREEGIGNRAVRLSQLNDLNDDLLALQQARGQEAQERIENGDALPAGAETGLLTERKKQIGTGARATIETEWAIDSTLVKERQSILEQAAKEVGDRDRRLLEVSGPEGGPVRIENAEAKFLEMFATEQGEVDE